MSLAWVRALIGGVVLSGSISGIQPGAGAVALQPTPGTLVSVTAPEPTDILSGTVLITGTVIDPAFRAYRLDYAPDPPVGEEAWLAIQAPVTQQVLSGVLGSWDTTRVSDGRYVIRVQVLLDENRIITEQIPITVANATATAPPTATEQMAASSESVTQGGPSATPLILQPPTRTPHPTETPGGPSTASVPLEQDDSPLQPARLRQSACAGSLVALAIFAALGLYGAVRAGVRGPLRRFWWRLRHGQQPRGRHNDR